MVSVSLQVGTEQQPFNPYSGPGWGRAAKAGRPAGRPAGPVTHSQHPEAPMNHHGRSCCPGKIPTCPPHTPRDISRISASACKQTTGPRMHRGRLPLPLPPRAVWGEAAAAGGAPLPARGQPKHPRHKPPGLPGGEGGLRCGGGAAARPRSRHATPRHATAGSPGQKRLPERLLPRAPLAPSRQGGIGGGGSALGTRSRHAHTEPRGGGGGGGRGGAGTGVTTTTCAAAAKAATAGPEREPRTDAWGRRPVCLS